jgi:hypothetical protein
LLFLFSFHELTIYQTKIKINDLPGQSLHKGRQPLYDSNFPSEQKHKLAIASTNLQIKRVLLQQTWRKKKWVVLEQV